MRLTARNQGYETIANTPATGVADFLTVMKSLLLLAKPGILLAELLAGVAGALLASPRPEPGRLWPIMLCLAMAAGGAAMANCLMEEEPDKYMPRLAKRSRALETAGRGLARKTSALLLCGAALVAVACFPPQVMVLLATAVIGYTLVYTARLKHRTPWSVLAGGIPGALPPLIAALAVSGSIPPQAFFLGMVIYVWQLPHFWFLALHYREEYQWAGIPVLAGTHGLRITNLLIMTACTALLATVILFGFSAGFQASFTAILAGAYCYFLFLGYCYLHRSMDYYRGFTVSIILLTGTILAVIGNILLNTTR